MYKKDKYGSDKKMKDRLNDEKLQNSKEIRNLLMKIYHLLYEHAGHQHWWPACSPFEVVIGAILAQFVSWKNVTIAIENLKKYGLLSVEGICSTDIDKLGELIKSTRFYRQKARMLKDFCNYLDRNYNGSLDRLFDKDINDLRKELLALYGIGEETADSIILYAANKPVFVVDAYTKRIFTRLGLLNGNMKYKEVQRFFMNNLEHDVELFNDYHAQIVKLGNSYCFNKNPKCNDCPLCNSQICKFNK